MNTNDFKPFEYKGPESFKEMFEKHYELFLKYMENEKYDWSPERFDINVAEDQFMLKDFLQIRFCEEITEVTMDLEHRDHVVEELVDALNFLMAAYFIYGIKYEDLASWDDSPFMNLLYPDQGPSELFYKFAYDVIEQTGRACNLLKNSRVWKTTQYLVDLYKFEPIFKSIWISFNRFCNICGVSQQKLFEVWSQKYQVNHMRMDTNY